MSSESLVVLVGCVKEKHGRPLPAKDLYRSALWRGRRSFAERSGARWFVLSAKYGLVDPDEVIEPYDLALADLPSAERRRWGAAVVAGLRRRLGTLEGSVVEVHAGAHYRGALETPLAAEGAALEAPLSELTLGRQLAWYRDNAAETASDAHRRRCGEAEVASALKDLDGTPHRVLASAWPADLQGLDHPGLYSWWVDEEGAADLTRGLGIPVSGGRIYAGQTGATKWPSGRAGQATLRSRIGGNHLRGNVGSSTFRHTLAVCLSRPLGLERSQEGLLCPQANRRLSEWMGNHLEVAVHPFPNRDGLGSLESRVLAALDPPLNLEGMPPTQLRAELTRLRRLNPTGRGAQPAESETERSSADDLAARSPVGSSRRPTGPTLHVEIAAILHERGNAWMTTRELADEVNRRGRYHKRDGSPMTAFQIHGRTSNYSQLFERDGSRVRLRTH